MAERFLPSFLSTVRRATKDLGDHAQWCQSPPASDQPSRFAITPSSTDVAEHGFSGLIFNWFGSLLQLTMWLDKHCLLGGGERQKQTLYPLSQIKAILDPMMRYQDSAVPAVQAQPGTESFNFFQWTKAMPSFDMLEIWFGLPYIVAGKHTKQKSRYFHCKW